MKYGLSDKQYQEIIDIIASYTDIEQAILFGSRAIDTYKEASDVDIAIKGKKVTFSLATKLKSHLEDETYLPFFFDIIAYNTISSEELKKHINSKGKVIYSKSMGGWREVKLGDVAEITSSKRIFYSDYVSSGVPFYRSKEIINKYNKQPIEKKLFISYEKFEEFKIKYGVPQHNDILLTSVGTLGIPYLVNKGEKFYFKDGNLTWFRNIKFNKINVYFLYIWFQSSIGKQKLDEIIIGSTQAALTIRALKSIKILLPPLPEQKAIAEVLSSLDDKIDLLHRQNQTLEAMAETLFRQWFVEEADESWEILFLSDIAEVKNGFAFSSKSYIDFSSNCLEVFKMGHIEKGGGLKLTPKSDFVPREKKLERYVLNKKDIVMAMTDMKDNVVILGVPAIIDKSNHYVLNQRVARIFLKNNEKIIHEYFIYIQLKDKQNIATLQSKANSGVQVNLSTKTIKEIEILVPPVEIQKEKGQLIIDLFQKKNQNTKQIQTLSTLRDTLLPKLMSGEVRLKNIKDS